MTPGSQTHFARLDLHLFASVACVLPVASYVLTTFGWRPADIGVGTAVLGIAGTLSSPFWGRLDDRTSWAPRAAVLASAAAAVLAALSLGRLPHVATWIALALFGAAEGPLDALLTTRVLASGLHGSRLGAVRSFGSLGWVVGLALAATVLTVWPEHAEWVLIAAAVTAVTSPLSWGRRAAEPPDGTAKAPGPAAVRKLPVRPVLGVLAVTFPSSLAMSTLVQFTAGWAHEALSAGPFLALSPIALSALLELPVFPLVDRLVRARTPLLVTVLAGPPLAVATAVLALFPSSVSMLAVQPLIALSFSLLFVGQSRLLSAAVSADRQASAQTLGSALIGGVGGLVAGVVGGRVADSLGYGGLFSCLVALTVAGTAIGVVALVRATRPDPTGPAPCPAVHDGCTVPANQ